MVRQSAKTGQSAGAEQARSSNASAACLGLLVLAPRNATVPVTDWVVFLASECVQSIRNAMLDNYACFCLVGQVVGNALLNRGQIVGEGSGWGRVDKLEFGVGEYVIERGGYSV